MHLIASLISSLLLTGSALAQYGSSGSGYGSGYGSGSDSSSVTAAAEVATSTASMMSASPASMMSAPPASMMSASAVPSGMVSVQVVKVSNKNATLKFTPNNIVAAAGSMVQFQFYPKNHSIVQSTFGQPCQPIANNMPNTMGFFSGFMPVAKGAADLPVYTLMINDTKPIWFYCSQGDHCQSGMVGVINAPANSNKTIDAFAALAAQAPANLSPGESSGSSGSYSSSSWSNATTPLTTASGGGAAMATTLSTGSVAGTTSSTAAPFTGGASSTFSSSKESLVGMAMAGLVAIYMAVFV